MRDPLYRPLTSLPGDGETVTLGGTRAEMTVTGTAPDVIDAQWMDDREVILTVTDDVDPDRFAWPRSTVIRPGRSWPRSLPGRSGAAGG